MGNYTSENINDRDSHGRTNLHWLCLESNLRPEFLQKMAQAGCMLATDKWGDTPLHLLCRWAKLELIEIGAKYGDMNWQNENGDTAAHVLAAGNYPEIIGKIRCNLRKTNKMGLTASEIATRNPKLTFELLISLPYVNYWDLFKNPALTTEMVRWYFENNTLVTKSKYMEWNDKYKVNCLFESPFVKFEMIQFCEFFEESLQILKNNPVATPEMINSYVPQKQEIKIISDGEKYKFPGFNYQI